MSKTLTIKWGKFAVTVSWDNTSWSIKCGNKSVTLKFRAKDTSRHSAK